MAEDHARRRCTIGMNFKTGLVVGKFYPPHRGHKHLIDAALARCERVTVLAVDGPGQSIPIDLRAAWLREIHPRADVRVIPDILNDDDSEAWAVHTARFLGWTPEAVFTSEPYGEPYARAMGCDHVLVDLDRRTFPVSGTAVRKDPHAQWDFLEPCVRAYFVKRVCVLGAESTGTTTLARALAERYKTVFVPEYGRFYAEGKYASGDPVWRTDEFVHIAESQSRMEDHLARSADKILICDTDPFATSVWHERYMRRPSPEVKAIADARKYDLYILTGDEIPFVQDGIRDGQSIRHWMHGRFEEALKASGRPYAVLRGSHAERLKAAALLIGGLFVEKQAVNT